MSARNSAIQGQAAGERRPDWRHRAACRDRNDDLFFPVGDSGPALPQIEAAKALCRTCPVSAECGDWALSSGQSWGIWGGMTEDERRARRRAA